MDSFLDWYGQFTPQVRGSFFVTAVLSIVLIIAGALASKADPLKPPKGIMIVAETLVEGMNDFAEGYFGKYYRIYAPLLVMISVFIGGSVILSLFKISNPLNSAFICLTLSSFVFFVIHITGVISNGGIGYLKGFLDPSPLFLPLNLIGELAVPVSLGLRLFGNLLSGALILMLVYGLIDAITGYIGISGYLLLVIPSVLHAIFDLFFGYIQILVFLLLSSTFISGKIADLE